MKDLDYIKALTDIDESFVQEALSVNDSTTKRRFSKRFVAIAVAAVMLVLLATGAGVISLISTNISTNCIVKVSKTNMSEVEKTELNTYEREFIAFLEDKYDDEYADIMEGMLKQTTYGKERNQEIASKYNIGFRGVMYYRIHEYEEHIVECGAFQKTNNGVFIYLNTDDNRFYSEARVFMYLYNDTTKEVIVDYAVIDRKGSYTANIDAEEGWTVLYAVVHIYHDYDIGGAGSTYEWADEEETKFLLKNGETVDFTREQFEELQDLHHEINRELNSEEKFRWRDVINEWLKVFN